MTEELKISIPIKLILKHSLKNKFQTEGFKETLQHWPNRVNTKTQDMLIILHCAFHRSIFTDTTTKDFDKFKQSLKDKDPNLTMLTWSDNLWNLMISSRQWYVIISNNTTRNNFAILLQSI